MCRIKTCATAAAQLRHRLDKIAHHITRPTDLPGISYMIAGEAL